MRRGFLLLFCCSLLLLGGCGNAKEKAYYEDGKKKMEDGAHEEAAVLFQESIDAEVRLPESYRAQGISYLEMGEYAKAIAALSRSLNSLEGSNQEFKKDVMYYLALAREEYGQIDEAIQVYTDILKMGADEQSFFLRGKLYLEKGDLEDASSDFSKALESSKDYELYINIYNVYVEHKMSAEGNEYLERALKIKPEKADDYYSRGLICYDMKDYKAAKEELTTAINQGSEDAVLLLGKVYIAMEDVGSARAMYQEYLNNKDAQAKAYNGLALCDIYEKNYSSALMNIEEGLKLGDADQEQSLLFNEIIVYEYQLDFETAKQKLSAYLELYPDDQAAIRENEFLQSR